LHVVDRAHRHDDEDRQHRDQRTEQHDHGDQLDDGEA
jgi:hypothetical protein